MGRYDEALEEAKRAQELDPLSPAISGEVGDALYFARKFDTAIDQHKKTLQMDSNYGLAHWDLAMAYAQKKMFPEAVAEWQTALTLPRASAAASKIAEACRVPGFQDFLQRFIDKWPQNLLPGERAYDIAELYALLGKKNEAVRSLQQAFNEREGIMVYLKPEPAFDPLRSDLDFQALVKKMNFPE